MFLDTCQIAKESLSDDEKFVALELDVLDDFISGTSRGATLPFEKEHLGYLAALHARGEGKLALELLNRALAITSNDSLQTEGSGSVAELLVLQAEMLMAMELFTEAEAPLRRAVSMSTSPSTTAGTGILYAKLLVLLSRKAEALVVLQGAYDSLAPAAVPTELVSALAAAYADEGDYEQAEGLLHGHLHRLSETPAPQGPDAAVWCRVQLASVLFEQGKLRETMATLQKAGPADASAPQVFRDLCAYYLAACSAVSSGRLLSECLSASPTFLSQFVDAGVEGLRLFEAFHWLRPSETSKDTMLRGFRGPETVQNALLCEVFRTEELGLQGDAYGRLSEGDYVGAVAAFQKLEELRAEASREGTLMAVVDSRALAFARAQAGHSGALDTVRRARRFSQLLLGLSSVGTLWIVLDEARVLLDRNDAKQAGVLVRQILTREGLPGDAREILLRLRLVLMEVDIRTGKAQQSLNSVDSLSFEAAALRESAPELEAILKYQIAAAKAAAGDSDAAEHEFILLRHHLEGADNMPAELSLKATYGLARVMQQRGEYTHALSLLRPLVNTSPDMSKPLSLRVRRRIAACHMSLNEYSAAANVYGSIANDLSNWAGDQDPVCLDMRLRQADSLLASGQYKPARRIYRTLWEVLHKDYAGREISYIRAVIGNATCLRRLKDYSGAVLNYRRIHNLEGRTEYMSQQATLELEKWLAWSLEMVGAQQEAAEHYSEAIRLLEELEPDRTGLLEDLRFRVLCCIG